MNMISGCLLVLLLCQSATAFFGGGGAFSNFMLSLGPKKDPLCVWNPDHPVPEATPLGGENICFDNTPAYDQMRINQALEGDVHARTFLRTVERLYQPMNQTYFKKQFTYGGHVFDYEDMCSVIPEMVHRVFADNPRTGQRETCNIVNPEDQNIYRAVCGMDCTMNGGVPVKNHFCVPDGYITRFALVFCPSSSVQCRPVKIKIPVGCSCKKYTCLKFSK